MRGIAAQSLFTALLVMAVNFRKISAHRQLMEDGTGHKVLERARRRRTSLEDTSLHRAPDSKHDRRSRHWGLLAPR